MGASPRKRLSAVQKLDKRQADAGSSPVLTGQGPDDGNRRVKARHASPGREVSDSRQHGERRFYDTESAGSGLRRRDMHPPVRPSSHDKDLTGASRFPLQDVQEACLLRYYVEELSHWFDLCDESRHFQLAVPVLARRHSHLLNAIFAVAARHLSRMPRFKTARGIEYHGQLLPRLDQNAPMEYMLQCIPAMRQFHDLEDNEYRESIVATAVILRQLEEIDDEEEATEELAQSGRRNDQGPSPTQINFLPIIDAILRSPPSRHLFAMRGVTQAAHWMALRQEIYHSFTRREPPQMVLAAEYWTDASKANKSVMHTVQVAKWCWGDRSQHEWDRLMAQQHLLEEQVLVDYQPILKKSPDKAQGEIFPTVWYGSTIEVTSNQQAIISRSVLMAENPRLHHRDTPRPQWRQLENDVKLLILELCGIALCHPASPPVLVNAAIGIQLYGDFFTDQYERQALKGVVEKYRDTHAWPVKRLLDMFS
ncbi:ARCA-like protein [Sarocladium implicatum]|nr:ARCA-like protein [Sarocladium implicatum]